MNRFLTAAALTGLVILVPAASAVAATEFFRPPAVGSDLTDPWLLQFKAGKKRPVLSAPGVTRNTMFAPPIIEPPKPVNKPQPVFFRAPAANTSAKAVNYPIDPEFLPRVIPYPSTEKAGTIIIDTDARHLYLIMGDGQALRYGVGVGRPGFEWAGVRHVTRMAEWPDWTPPPEMLKRKPELPRHMDGGPNNPLGARALYLGSTLYRIHGSNEPWTIGHAVSSGCIRMRNEDVTDLYERVSVGAKVIVL
jgi:lipoprotein-anchoring transpeptidase ErfK/SrfK